MLDLESLKCVPSYQAVLKLVLKSQIQFLIEQLSDHAGEDCIVLTANALEGSLSHLGSRRGTRFIEDHSDIKTQFLGFCLKGDLEDKRDKVQQSQAQLQPEDVHSQRETNGRKRKLSGTKKPLGISEVRSINNSSTNSADIGRDKHVDIKDGGEGSGSSESERPSDNDFDKPVFYKKRNTGLPAMKDSGLQSNTEEKWSSRVKALKEEPAIKIELDDDDDPYPHSSDGLGDSLSYGDMTSWDASQNLDSAYRQSLEPAAVSQSQSSYRHYPDMSSDSNTGISPGIDHKFGNESEELSKDCDGVPQYAGDAGSSKEGRIFTCDICHRTFKRKFNMEQHRKLHFGIKNFTCDDCNRSFSRHDRLRTHYLRHHSGITLDI